LRAAGVDFVGQITSNVDNRPSNMAETGLNFHPEAKAYLELKLWEAFDKDENKSIEKLRSTLDEVSKVGGVGTVKDYEGTREEHFVDSKEVDGGIPVYVYKPKSLDHESDGVPILVYFHGGGNVMGSRGLVDDTCKMLSSQAGCIVVNVEYRLAPEHKFPAMINDAYAAVRWVLDNRVLVGGSSKSKVGVSGDSAGGQIAASVSHHVPGVDFQILIYPWLNIGHRDYPSHQEFKNGPVIVGDLLSWIESQVVEKKEDLHDPRFGILHNKKYDHLPPTLLIVAEFDALRDESYEYSKRLTAAGVDNQVFQANGAIHGYYTTPGAFVELCGQSYAKAVEFINKIRKQH